jgi:hypothetical protein
LVLTHFLFVIKFYLFDVKLQITLQYVMKVHEEVVSLCSYLNLMLHGGWLSVPVPGALPPCKSPVVYCREGWVGPRSGQMVVENRKLF